jgi:tight adherence protein C
MISVLDLIIELLMFCIVVAVTFALVRQAEHMLEQRRRLGHQSPSGHSSSSAPLLRGVTVENRFFQWVQSSTSISDTAERARLRRELSLAGFDSPNAPVWYVICRFSLAIVMPLAFLLVQTVLPKPAAGLHLVIGALIFCGVGLLAPASFVSRRAAARRAQIEREFPDALDLLVVCIEAGLNLDAAFVRVGEEIGESHPRIQQEILRVSEELRAGGNRADALRAMADRTAVDGVKSFVALVIQTEALGASIAQALRTYSTEMRETRFLKAEEKAMRIPVLMTVPLVACILPVIITALLLPAMIDVVRHLIPALSGHGGG